MSAPFTPGPWTTDWDDSGQWYVNIGGFHVSGTALRGGEGDCVEAANARLIAAAPDLYEALKDCIKALESHQDIYSGVYADALEKAERELENVERAPS